MVRRRIPRMYSPTMQGLWLRSQPHTHRNVRCLLACIAASVEVCMQYHPAFFLLKLCNLGGHYKWHGRSYLFYLQNRLFFWPKMACSVKRLLYLPPCLIFINSLFCPQCIYVFFNGSQKKKQRLFLYELLTYRFLYNQGRECLLRGTDRVFNHERSEFCP